MLKIFTRFSTYTLLVALVISVISAYYSIVGLTAIFAAAVVPIIIMGAALELGKLAAAVWLKLNWARAGLTYKMYLMPAVAFLMILTSMGIFGFLSKAHSDQSLVSGDVIAKISIYDEKIKIAKDNIDANRKALKQMDEAVDQTLGRSATEQGADKAVQIRRSQGRERARLLADIEAEQKKISQLMEDRAPLASEVRKVEAEVGPIKYIAAIIYGDNPDANLLESAVRWVIIMIVIVFDPLALMLILAAQQSMRWEREEEQAQLAANLVVQQPPESPQSSEQSKSEPITEEEFTKEATQDPGVSEFFERARAVAQALDRGDPIPGAQIVEQEQSTEVAGNSYTVTPETHSYLFRDRSFHHKPEGFVKQGPMVYKPEDVTTMVPETIEFTTQAPPDQTLVYDADVGEKPTVKEIAAYSESESLQQEITADATDTVADVSNQQIQEIQTDGVTQQAVKFHPSEGYVVYEGKNMSIEALRGMHPELIMSSSEPVNQIMYGGKFPHYARNADIYIRIDALPHRVYKFNGAKWISLDKNNNTSYLQYIPYLNYLISILDNGQYDPDMLTDAEQEEIALHLEKTKS